MMKSLVIKMTGRFRIFISKLYLYFKKNMSLNKWFLICSLGLIFAGCKRKGPVTGKITNIYDGKPVEGVSVKVFYDGGGNTKDSKPDNLLQVVPTAILTLMQLMLPRSTMNIISQFIQMIIM